MARSRATASPLVTRPGGDQAMQARPTMQRPRCSDVDPVRPTTTAGTGHDIGRVRVLQRQSTDPPATTASPGKQGGGAQATSAPAGAGGFDKPWQAALEALAICNPKSILSTEKSESIFGTEFGGLVFKLGGKFFFTEPMEGEEGHVDVWKALPRVPVAARTSIVGDYHTHGSGKTSGGAAVAEGEEFSGFHADPLAGLLPSLQQRGDIGETRADVATRKEILDPKTYTAFLATPQGRFVIFIPAQNLVFSFSPNPRLLPPGAKVPPAAYAH